MQLSSSCPPCRIDAPLAVMLSSSEFGTSQIVSSLPTRTLQHQFFVISTLYVSGLVERYLYVKDCPNLMSSILIIDIQFWILYKILNKKYKIVVWRQNLIQ